jgi:HK97 family phage portal protein
MPITDPRFIQWLTGAASDGAALTEASALTLSAFYRGCLVVSGSIGGLPLRTLRDVEGSRTRVNSMFDNPGAVVGLKPYNWKQIQVLHQILWGDAFLRHIFNQAGALVGMEPIHPSCVKVEWDRSAEGGKRFSFKDDDGTLVELDAKGMTQVMGPSLDGLRGLSLLTLARRSLGGAIASDQAAAKMWRNGMMLAALVTPADDMDDEDDIEAAVAEMNAKMGGVENAGMLRAVNRKVKVDPLSMPLKDAQFLESRQFSIQEAARWLGVPASLLMDPGAVSTWGTGVEIQQRGLARFTLPQYTIPMQEAYTAALRGERFTEFDFAGLERGSPQEEIGLLLQQVAAGVMSKEEFRHIRNMGPMNPDETFVDGPPASPPPLSPADVLRVKAYAGSPAQPSIDAMTIAGAIAGNGALS